MTTFVDIQGEKLAVEFYEPTTRIADVVLVHGFTGSKEDFNLIGPLLAEAGYRVLTFDNRGQHESAHSAREDSYHVQSLARDVIELVEHFGLEKPHLLGHSFGGLVSQRALVESPQSFASLTIFCSGPHYIPNKPDLAATIKIMETMPMQESWDRFKEETDKLLPRYELYKKRWTASDPRSTHTMALHLQDAQPLIEQLVATHVPIHVVYGENDDAWPLEMQDQMAKDLSAPRTIIKAAGHCPNEDQPEDTVSVLTNFWNSL
jgi:pimeloyl-ACP methyl ester carboxylesterase